MTGRDEVEWAQRVSKELVRRLYVSDAQGMLDEELLDDVGTRLYQRCLSILQVTEARQGRVRCPRCQRSGQETVIQRNKVSGERDDLIVCPVCGWQVTWLEYARTFKRRQLNSGGAISAFSAYVRSWPAARSPQEKMLAVDHLIHAFHYSLQRLPDLPTRPAALNLINGKLEDTIRFLDELSYGPGSTPTLDRSREEWQQTVATYRRDFPRLVLGYDLDEEDDSVE